MSKNREGGSEISLREIGHGTNRREFRFLDYCLDSKSLELTLLGDRIALPPKATQLLLMLLDKAPRLVTRDELRNELWRDSTIIEFEGSLNTCVRQVRSALGDSASRSTYIQTLPKRGYRFVAKLEQDSPSRRRYGLQAAALAVGIAVVVFFASTKFRQDGISDMPELLVVLPVEVSTSQAVDQLAGYGIAMIASGRVGDLQPHRLAVVNSRSLRSLSARNAGHDRLRSPDYVVRTRIRELNNEYVLDASLRRTDTGEILSTRTDILGTDISTVLRISPEIIVEWLSDALGLADGDGALHSSAGIGNAWDNELVAAYWHLEANTLESVTLALEKFDKVLMSNPRNVWALEGKLAAMADISFWQSGTSAAEKTFVNMESIARFMLDNDIHSGSSYQAIAFVNLFRDWNVSAATNNTEAALLISPDNARNHSLFAAAQAAGGNTAAAVRSAEMAERLDPATMAVRSDRCWYLLFDGKYQEAAELCASVLSLDDRDFAARLGSAQAQASLGNKTVALKIMIDAIRMIDDDAFEYFTALPLTWEELGCLRVDEVLSDGTSSKVLHFQRAKYYAQCGKPADTLNELRLSLNRREYPALFMNVSPEFESLHDDPEFKKLQQLLP